MATAGYRTIEVGHYDAGPKKEAIGSGTIKPGFLLERTSAAAATVKAHATSGGYHGGLFAVEDDLQGKEISESYATGNKVFFRAFRRGDEVYAYLADGQNVAIGAALMSNGAGALTAYDPEDSAAPAAEVALVGYALEAVDLSGSANLTAIGRILIEVA